MNLTKVCEQDFGLPAIGLHGQGLVVKGTMRQGDFLFRSRFVCETAKRGECSRLTQA